MKSFKGMNSNQVPVEINLILEILEHFEDFESLGGNVMERLRKLTGASLAILVEMSDDESREDLLLHVSPSQRVAEIGPSVVRDLVAVARDAPSPIPVILEDARFRRIVESIEAGNSLVLPLRMDDQTIGGLFFLGLKVVVEEFETLFRMVALTFGRALAVRKNQVLMEKNGTTWRGVGRT